MFIKIDRPHFGELVLNAALIVQMQATSVTWDTKKYKVTRIVMSDGQKHDAFETVAVLMKRLAGGKDA